MQSNDLLQRVKRLESQLATLQRTPQLAPSQLVPTDGVGTDVGKPGQPVGLTIVAGFKTLYALWDQNTESDMINAWGSYRAELALTEYFTSVIDFRNTGAATSAVFGDLTPGTIYWIRVIAIDAQGNESDAGEVVSGVPLDVPPAANGIEPVAVLPTLPDAAYPQGKVVFLTTTNQLWRSTGTVWTAAVPTVDLTGQITTTQITDDAVIAVKIAALTITAAKIAANTITSGQIAANTITAGQIAASTITAAQIAATTITAAQIAAATITATQIAAATITGTQIAAATISAGNIVAGTITATQLAALTLTVGQYVQSSSYVANVSGWHINESGFAEFQNILARGIFMTSLTGQRAVLDNDSLELFPGDLAGGEVPASMFADTDNILTLQSSDSATLIAQLLLAGQSSSAYGGSAFHVKAKRHRLGVDAGGTPGSITHPSIRGGAMRLTTIAIPSGGAYSTCPVTAGGVVLPTAIGATWDTTDDYFQVPGYWFDDAQNGITLLLWMYGNITSGGTAATKGFRFQKFSISGGTSIDTYIMGADTYTSLQDARISGTVGIDITGTNQAIRLQAFQNSGGNRDTDYHWGVEYTGFF